MSNILTTNQVNENLKRLFPGTTAKCYKVENFKTWYEATQYFFWIPTKGIVVIDNKKNAYVRYFNEAATLESEAAQIQNKQHADFKAIFRIGKHEYNLYQDKKTIEKLLLACEIKKEKTESVTARLQKIAGSTYVKIYKMITELQIVSAYVDTIKARHGFRKVIVVKHSKGEFKFAFENAVSHAYDEEIQNIFSSLLHIPLSNHIAA